AAARYAAALTVSAEEDISRRVQGREGGGAADVDVKLVASRDDVARGRGQGDRAAAGRDGLAAVDDVQRAGVGQDNGAAPLDAYSLERVARVADGQRAGIAEEDAWGKERRGPRDDVADRRRQGHGRRDD